jgi:hypothetical protein
VAVVGLLVVVELAKSFLTMCAALAYRAFKFTFFGSQGTISSLSGSGRIICGAV